MKNARLLTILIVLVVVLSLTFAAIPAYAEDADLSRNENSREGRDYDIITLVDDAKNVVGVKFGGLYFGASGIEVWTEIFSDENTVIDFNINETPAKLTAAQQVTQARILELADAAHNFIRHIDNAVNAQYNGQGGLSESYIFQYNNAECGETIEVDEDTYNMLQIARQMYIATNGAFNPAVYRLVDLWGFSSRTYRRNGNLPYDRQWYQTDDSISYPLPEQKYIDAFSNPDFTDFSQNAVTLTSDNGKFSVTKNVKAAIVDGEPYNQWLDLGGIAKGYVVDGIRDMIRDFGLTRFYADAGTSSQVYGANYDGGDWIVAARDPYKFDYFNQPAVMGTPAKNATVSSSGQYERKFVTNGVEYAHIIDGTAGAPAQTGITSITIVAPEGYSASQGDCLTTALTVMGRDRIVEFMNGYLKANGIKVFLIYETVDGARQLLSNIDERDVVKGDTFDEYAWSVNVDDDGKLFYDASAKAPIDARNHTALIIVLGVIVAAAVVAVIVVHFVKGKGKIERNILNAKRDKPFKLGDVGVYLAVALLIVVLFAVFFGKSDEQIRNIQAVDFSNSNEGELLFAYNVARNEWVVYSDNSGGWTVDVTEQGNDITVKFSREKDGKQQCNVMTITRGTNATVKMIEATCDDKTCVYNFPAATVSERAIVCSPNRLKIITG